MGTGGCRIGSSFPTAFQVIHISLLPQSPACKMLVAALFLEKEYKHTGILGWKGLETDSWLWAGFGFPVDVSVL